MKNKSDETKRPVLGWKLRYNIIQGIELGSDEYLTHAKLIIDLFSYVIRDLACSPLLVVTLAK